MDSTMAIGDNVVTRVSKMAEISRPCTNVIGASWKAIPLFVLLNS